MGGGSLALTGAAVGSWVVAGVGLVLLGSFLLFMGARARRT
jgi:hypothetical protein